MKQDTIAAIATAPGEAAIAVLRLSGEKAVSIADKLFVSPRLKSLQDAVAYHQYFGEIREGDALIDEVLLTVFKAPRSYTGEDVVEIACHGSLYIQEKILQLLMREGAVPAKAGEFTQRAYLNGKMDLSQAEAVADIIASRSKGAHRIAMNQMRGGFSVLLKKLRSRLLDFASLLELELDFSEEDVEFADRKQFLSLIDQMIAEMERLIASFSLGNVIKNGIPVAIVGEPNVGKSTLLNALLNEERAIVSSIPGTTRDTVEDILQIGPYQFRFIDTAGLRQGAQTIEEMGIKRAFGKMEKAHIILAVFDSSTTSTSQFQTDFSDILAREDISLEGKYLLFVGNKKDLLNAPVPQDTGEVLYLSAKEKEAVENLKDRLLDFVRKENAAHQLIVNNLRHVEALQKSVEALQQAKEAFENALPEDLIAVDIRSALYHLGTITGEISSPEILQNIFGKFCIGK